MLLPSPEHPELPLVILDVQMFQDPLFFHRLRAEVGHHLLQQSMVMRWQVVVRTPLEGLHLGTELEDLGKRSWSYALKRISPTGSKSGTIPEPLTSRTMGLLNEQNLEFGRPTPRR